MSEQPPQQLASSWNDTANDYDEMFVPFTAGAAQAALDTIKLQPGERFLDIAAGTGSVTLNAVRAGAKVVAIDFAAGMLDVLAKKLKIAGFDDVQCEVMDGQNLTLPDAQFDAAGSNLGLIFFPDINRGLAEMLRVLRRGGRGFVTSLPATPNASPLMGLVVRALMTVYPKIQLAGPSFQLSSAASMTEAFTQAGFSEVTARVVSVEFPLGDARAFWNQWVLQAPPTIGLIKQVPEELRSAAGEEFARLVAANRTTGDPAFPSKVLIGCGRRPA